MNATTRKIKGVVYYPFHMVATLRAQHKHDIDQLEKLLVAIRDNLAHYTKREEELTEELKDARHRYNVLKHEYEGSEKRHEEELRRQRATTANAVEMAEEAAIAAGQAGRVSARLMEHVDEYIHDLKKKANG